jgi:hypothetical protein
LEKAGIVAFGFGAPASIWSNKTIAEIAEHKAKREGASVYTQLDIQIADRSIVVQYTEEKPGQPPPTLRICRGAVAWAKKHGITRLYIAAAKPHLWRCQRDLYRAVKEAKADIKVRFCEEISQFSENSWFCPGSTQERCQTQASWRKRERILGKLPFWLYKIIAR